MNTFLHTADNRIIINGHEFPLSTFQTFEPLYTLGSTYEERIYIKNISHTVLDQDTNNYQNLGAVWAEGDIYISKVNDYLASTTTEALEQIIDRYESIKDEFGYSNILDSSFNDEFRLDIVESAFRLNDYEKASFEETYPEFTNLTEAISQPAINRILSNRLLRSDWTQLADASLSVGAQTAWDNYRTSLRALFVPTYTSLTQFSIPIEPADYLVRA